MGLIALRNESLTFERDSLEQQTWRYKEKNEIDSTVKRVVSTWARPVSTTDLAS